MLYSYFILVTSHRIIISSGIVDRSIKVGISAPDLDQASALSDMPLSEIKRVLPELDAVISGQLDYFDWGTDLFYVDSEAALSSYGDYDKAERTQVSTTDLRNFLIELKNFKEKCQAEDYYKIIIGQAFTAIKDNPSQYQRWPTSDVDFLIVLNNITFTLTLLEDDFKLTEAQYVAQLQNYF